MPTEKSAEGMVGSLDRTEGPNRRSGKESYSFVNEAAPEKRVERFEVDLWAGSRKLQEALVGGAYVSTGQAQSNPENQAVMEAVVERGNTLRALAAVEGNGGAAGVDGVTTKALRQQLRQDWGQIKASLLAGTYQPQPVRQVEIPKAGSGRRLLGIPTVMDRLIQQAVHQVLSPVSEGSFSEYSYGFRPGRGARQAVKTAQKHVQSGKRWVVDMDLKIRREPAHGMAVGRGGMPEPLT